MSNAFLEKLNTAIHEENIPSSVGNGVLTFYKSYQKSLESHNMEIKDYNHLFLTFLRLLKEHYEKPFIFEPYHKALRSPFDYYKFGLEFVKPLIEIQTSSVVGRENLKKIIADVSRGDNVIFLANHQTEADPQAISIMLENCNTELAENIIFVAGERVTTDPLAVPFSMGCNLLCIYSKRYIDYPPEMKLKKQLHNKRTMELMSALLSEGGKCIYVAPSGGRDRVNNQGIVEVAPFDPQSIEMLYLMAKRSMKKTHFYPLALATYDLLPPPETIQIELGETRITKRGAIHLAFGDEIDMEKFPGHETQDKHHRREVRAEFIWNLVNKDYQHIST